MLISDLTFTKAYPLCLLVSFIVLINLVMLYHYIPLDRNPVPPNQNNTTAPYNPPQYGLKLVRPKDKKYVSESIEKYLTSLETRMKDKDLYTLLQNCLPNTLDTTVEWFNADHKDPRTFLITGDIPAMWIRDSTNQITPYLRFKEDKELRDLVFGVLQVQASYLTYDPYANAFLRPWYAPKDENQRKGSTSDRVVPPYDPDIVWESKYELDSLGHFFQLTNDYIEATGDIERVITSKDWLNAVARIFQVLKDQMQDTWPASQINFTPLHSSTMARKDPEPVSLKDGYRFRRYTDRPTETLGEYGIGGITKKCGLIRSAFRPSDDATTFPYLIPANAQLSTQLIKLGERIELHLLQNRFTEELTVQQQRMIGIDAKTLGEKVRKAIYEHAVVTHPVYGQVFAYEVDCYGSQLLMDDANTPSLLSLPVLGFVDVNDTVYQNTRNFVLSAWNPWYFEGAYGKGIGGPHTGQNMVWPMSVLMQIQTSTSETEVIELVDMLKRMANTTGSLMCESFNVHKPNTFTRPWFSWANGLAGSTILKIIRDYPHLA